MTRVRLTEPDAMRIRWGFERGLSRQELAERFHVGYGQVCKVIRGEIFPDPDIRDYLDDEALARLPEVQKVIDAILAPPSPEMVRLGGLIAAQWRERDAKDTLKQKRENPPSETGRIA